VAAMSNGKRRILILGAGAWQIAYLRRAKELGCEVFATDWSKDAPGACHADVFEPIDLKDVEATVRFAEHNRVNAVLTAADIGVPTAAEVAARLGLRFHSRELATQATDKSAMRAAAQRAGIGGPRFLIANSPAEAWRHAESIGFPLIVKPADNCSSRGVTCVADRAALPAAVDEAFAASRARRVLFEEFMRGVEGSVEALVVDGQPVILGVCDKVKSPLPHRYDLQLIYPGNYSPGQLARIHELIARLVRGLDIRHGILHVEIMVGEYDARLIEFALRGCGSNVITHLIPAMTGVDVVKHLIEEAFGLENAVHPDQSRHGILKFIMLPHGRLQSIAGLDELRATPGVVDADLERRAGDVIGEIRDGRSRPGHVIAVGASRAEVESIAAAAIAKLRLEYEPL
jgi:biotin carboxylase